MAELVTIKKIKTAAGDHDIDAKYWDGHSFSEITDLVHGVVDTYVIPAQTTGTSDYKAIVESNAAQVETTTSKLATLVGQPSDFDKFGVGDIVLMGATSDGTKNFDRWISYVSGNVIKLDVLETQVATHHHTLGVSTEKAITGMNTPTQTALIPTVGSAVSVITGVSGHFLTSVEFSGGNDDLGLSHESGTGSVSHKHNVKSHSHDITPSTLVSQTVSVYTSLTSESKVIHSHDTETVAGAHTDASNPITIVTGSNGSDTFVKTLKQTPTNTGENTKGKETGSNTSGLSTNAQASTDTITSDIQTLSSGEHTHTVTTTTTENVVKTVTVAPSVVTSVSHSFTAPTVQTNVVTSITTAAKTVVSTVSLTGTTTFMSTWTASVDTNGILSFATTSATVGISTKTSSISAVGSITSGTQSAGSLSINAPRSSQSHTSGIVSASGSAASNGGHTHGFGHTHVIPSHTHTIAAHTHTYDKATVDASATAITSLSTTSYTPHTHENVTVAGVTSGETTITYITGGSRTDVVRNLKTDAVSTTSSAPETNEVYTKLTGDIVFPGLTITSSSISVVSGSITPAIAGTEKAIKSITFTSANFVTGLTTSGDIKTSENKGGK